MLRHVIRLQRPLSSMPRMLRSAALLPRTTPWLAFSSSLHHHSRHRCPCHCASFSTDKTSSSSVSRTSSSSASSSPPTLSSKSRPPSNPSSLSSSSAYDYYAPDADEDDDEDLSPASPDAPWSSQPPSRHFPPGHEYDPVTDSFPIAPVSPLPPSAAAFLEPEFPLPPLPPSSFLYPPPSSSYLSRRAGSFLDCYKHATLTLLLQAYQSLYGPSFTYIGIGGGPVGLPISSSINRSTGIDCVYEYGKWWAGLARKTHHTTRHTFIPLMHAVRLMNGKREGEGGEVSRLERGFTRYPGNAAVVRSMMRPMDRAIFFEPDQHYRQQLLEYFNQTDDDYSLPNLTGSGSPSTYLNSPPPTHPTSVFSHDHRVVVHPYSPWEITPQFSPLHSLGKPLTSHALIHIDLTQDRWENYRHMESHLIRSVLPSLFAQFPHATFMTSVPLYGNQSPHDLIRAHVKGGHRDVMLLSHYVQQLVKEDDNGRGDKNEVAEIVDEQADDNFWPDTGPLPIDEPWGIAILLVKPPSNFDGRTVLLQEDVDDVTYHIPHVDTANVDVESVLSEEEEQGDWVVRSDNERAFVAKYAEYVVSDSPLPPFVWLTDRWLDGVDREGAFEFTHTRLKKDLPNDNAVWEGRVKEMKRREVEGSKRGREGYRYWNEAKLMGEMRKRPVVREASKKGKRVRGEEEKVEEKKVTVVTAVSDGVKREVERLHENEGKLLDAWKAEVAKRTNKQAGTGGGNQ